MNDVLFARVTALIKQNKTLQASSGRNRGRNNDHAVKAYETQDAINRLLGGQNSSIPDIDLPQYNTDPRGGRRASQQPNSTALLQKRF